MLRWMPVTLVSLAMLVGAAVTASGAPVQAERGAIHPSTSSPNPSSTKNVLRAVTVVSASNAWAAGDYTDDATSASKTLILHWDGTSWSQIATPNPSSTENRLFGVSAVSAGDAWAVGDYIDDATGATDTLILHWDGTRWTKVSSPNPSPYNFLLSVSAHSATDVWAVGHHERSVGFGCGCRTLILHWDGRIWSKVKSPSPNPAGNFLLGVASVSASDVWAAGYDHISQGDTLILHWDGTRWTKITSPSPSDDTRNLLFGVSATSATNAWAVGGYTYSNRSLILHWNGRHWSQVGSPNPSSFDNFLNGVSAARSNDGWAVGYYRKNATHVYRTFVLHWNGSHWSRVKSPSPSSVKFATNAGYANELNGVSAQSKTNAWAIGDYVNDATGATETLILHWDGTSWSRT